MTIDPDMLMAYADGELDPIAARRVEQAIERDPALAAQLERHRALAGSLRAAFGPIAAEPPPAAAVRALKDAAQVVPLVRPAPARRERPLWIGAIAASLVAGLFAGPMIFSPDGGAGIAFDRGTPIARGDLAHALDTQLAATQQRGSPVRIGVSFRNSDGELCRSFEQQGTGGIACAGADIWRIERLYAGVAQQPAQYRQAGSATAAMMRDAQEMMVGEPLTGEEERIALSDR
jgi:hypothetical protein